MSKLLCLGDFGDFGGVAQPGSLPWLLLLLLLLLLMPYPRLNWCFDVDGLLGLRLCSLLSYIPEPSKELRGAPPVFDGDICTECSAG